MFFVSKSPKKEPSFKNQVADPARLDMDHKNRLSSYGLELPEWISLLGKFVRNQGFLDDIYRR